MKNLLEKEAIPKNYVFKSAKPSWIEINSPQLKSYDLIISWDTEWKDLVKEGNHLKNSLLSYQYCSYWTEKDFYLEGIFYQNSPNLNKERRLTLQELLDKICLKLGIFQENQATRKEIKVLLISHFSLAEWSMLKERNSLLKNFVQIKETIASAKSFYLNSEFFNFSISWKDTSLFSFYDNNSLSNLCEFTLNKKVQIDDKNSDHWISNMNELMVKKPEIYQEYSINDSRVALEYYCLFINKYYQITKIKQEPNCIEEAIWKWFLKFSSNFFKSQKNFRLIKRSHHLKKNICEEVNEIYSWNDQILEGVSFKKNNYLNLGLKIGINPILSSLSLVNLFSYLKLIGLRKKTLKDCFNMLKILKNFLNLLNIKKERFVENSVEYIFLNTAFNHLHNRIIDTYKDKFEIDSGLSISSFFANYSAIVRKIYQEIFFHFRKVKKFNVLVENSNNLVLSLNRDEIQIISREYSKQPANQKRRLLNLRLANFFTSINFHFARGNLSKFFSEEKSWLNLFVKLLNFEFLSDEIFVWENGLFIAFYENRVQFMENWGTDSKRKFILNFDQRILKNKNQSEVIENTSLVRFEEIIEHDSDIVLKKDVFLNFQIRLNKK